MSRALIVLGLILQCFVMSAQDIEPALLWKIVDKNNAEPASYLFGTIHLIDSNNYFIPDTLNTIISSVDEVCFEIKIDGPMEMMLGLLSMGDKLFLPLDETIDQFLEDDDIKLLEERIAANGLPGALLKRLKPIFISTMLGNEMESSSSGKSYEIEIGKLAAEHKIGICGLESLEDQLSVFDQIPMVQQVEQLTQSLHSLDAQVVGLDSLIYYYTNQDIEKLDQMIQRELGQADMDLTEVFLNKRNRNWVKKIVANLNLSQDKQSVLYAVGAGHLAGDNGLIQLLKKEEIELIPIYFKWKDNDID